MPNSEENERRRQQKRQHITKGRECERHFSLMWNYPDRRLLWRWGSCTSRDWRIHMDTRNNARAGETW